MFSSSEETCYINFKDGKLQVFDPSSTPDLEKTTIPSQHLSVYTPPRSPHPMFLTAPLSRSARNRVEISEEVRGKAQDTPTRSRPRLFRSHSSYPSVSPSRTGSPQLGNLGKGKAKETSRSPRPEYVRSRSSYFSGPHDEALSPQPSISKPEAAKKSRFSRPQLSRTHSSILAAPISQHLTTPHSISKVSRANLLYYLVASAGDVKVPIDNRPGAKLHPEDPMDLRLICEMFGQRKFFVFDIEDTYCPKCVAEKEERAHTVMTSREAFQSFKASFTTALSHPTDTYHNISKAMSTNAHHNPYHCTHNPPPMIFQLFRSIGRSKYSLISHLRLTGNFSTLQPALSSLSNLLTLFPKPSSFTITLHRPPHHPHFSTRTTPCNQRREIDTPTAYRLARVLASIERELPAGERLRIEGLKWHKEMRREWDRKKKEWWEVRPGGNHVRVAWGLDYREGSGGWGVDYRWDEGGGEMPVLMGMRNEMMPTIMRDQ